MKRLGSSFLLAVIVLSLIGPYGYFIVRLQQIRVEMRTALRSKPNDALELLKLSSQEFEKVQINQEEIEVEGRMYDVARIERIGNEVLVYCLHDEDEDNLLTLLDSILKNATKDKKPVPVSPWILAVVQPPPSMVLSRMDPSGHRGATNYRFMISNSELAVLSPPPKA